VAPLATVARLEPTATPTIDHAQVDVVAIRALAVDGNVLYGDEHIRGTSKYDFVAYNLETGETTDLGTAADAAAVASGVLVWTTFTVEDGGGGKGIPGCGWSIARWRMYKLLPSAAKSAFVARGDSYRPGWGECADSMPPLIAFDGTSVAYADGSGAITIIDVDSGLRKRTIPSANVDALAMSNGSIAFLQEDNSRQFNDDRLMLASSTGAPKILQEHASWFAMAGGRIAWIAPDTTGGAVSTESPAGSETINLSAPFTSVTTDDLPGPWDSLVSVSTNAVAWSWPSDRESIAYWREGQTRSCLIPTPGVSGLGLVSPISIGNQWLVWMDDPGARPGEWQEMDDPDTYAVSVEVLSCS
jgi:hypothetical protein